MDNVEDIESKIKIRDFKAKKVGKQTLLGLELESKSSHNYGNKIHVNFIKKDKVAHTEDISIPLIAGDGIFYVGKAFAYTDFDDIKLELEPGIISYQDSYYPTTTMEFDKAKSNEKHLEFKVENNSSETYDYAILSLVFYNRGEIVCGTDIEIKKILNGRPYYFVYDIPKEIEFTDIKTELILPNTNRLLFRGFYNDYKTYELLITSSTEPIKRRPHEKFVDNSDELKKSLEEVKAERKERSKAVTNKDMPKFILKRILISLGLGLLITLGVTLGLMVLGMASDGKNMTEIDGMDVFLIIVFAISSLVVFIKRTKKEKYSIPRLTVEEKEADLKECDEVIAELEKAIVDLRDNKEEYVKRYEAKNKEIDEYNKEMDELDEKRKNILAESKKNFEEFKSQYPVYRVIEKYDDIDRGFVDAAISQGAITWDSVEMYRKEARKQFDDDVKFKQELEELKKRNQLIAEQNDAIKASAEQQRRDAEAMREQVAAQARRHDSLVMQQIQSNEKLYKQREYYGNQISTKIDDLRYQEYLNSRYPSYWER